MAEWAYNPITGNLDRIGQGGGGGGNITISGDIGPPITANIFNIVGQEADSIPIVEVDTTTGDVVIANNSWQTQFIVDPSNISGLKGTFTTLADAINAASSGDVIFLRKSVTEDVNLKSGVNITSFSGNELTPLVSIVGKLTMNESGNVTISNIRLETNNDYFLEISGSSASIVNLQSCFLNVTNNDGINFSNSNSSSILNINYCRGNITTTDITLFNKSSPGMFGINFTRINNTGQSIKPSTMSSSTTRIIKSNLNFALEATGGGYDLTYTDIDLNGVGVINVQALTLSGNGSTSVHWCRLTAMTQAAASVDDGHTLRLYGCTIENDALDVIIGDGNCIWGFLFFTGQSSNIATNLQQTSVQANYRLKVTTPSSYPYLVKIQDELIPVDTSDARIINLPTNAISGFKVYIKDDKGLASINNITVTNGTIDNSSSLIINIDYASVLLCYNGIQWNVL